MEEFAHPNQITALAQSYDLLTAGPLLAIQIWITYACLLANHIRTLFKRTRVPRAGQTKKMMAQSHSLAGQGLGTWLVLGRFLANACMHALQWVANTANFNNYVPSSNLLFWNNQYLPSKGIESWNLALTQVNMENGSVNILKFVVCFHFQVVPL